MMYYHFKQYGTLYLIAMFCLITALIAGATSALKVSSSNQQRIIIVETDYVQGIIRNIILSVVMVMILFASGPCYLGILVSPAIIGYLGFEAGYSIMFLMLNQKIKGVMFSLLGLALSNTFMFIAIIYASVMVSSFSLRKIARKTKNIKAKNQKEQTKYMVQLLVVLFTMIVIGTIKVFLQQVCGSLLY